jgi:hypothetical protein
VCLCSSEVEVNLRPTVSRPPVLVSGSHLEPMTRFNFISLTIADFLMWSTLSDERMGLLFTSTIASGPCQSSSRVRVPQNSRPYLAVLFETPQPGGPGPRIYIPQEQCGPVIRAGTGFSFVTSMV